MGQRCKGETDKGMANSRSSVIWSAVPGALSVFFSVDSNIARFNGAVAPKGPMTYGTTQGRFQSSFLNFYVPSFLRFYIPPAG